MLPTERYKFFLIVFNVFCVSYGLVWVVWGVISSLLTPGWTILAVTNSEDGTEIHTTRFCPVNLILVGLMVTGAAVLGFLCCYRRRATLLFVYLFVLLVIGMSEIGFGVFFFTNLDMTYEQATSRITTATQGYYSTASRVDRQMVEHLQSSLKCCGAFGPDDFPSDPPQSCCADPPSCVMWRPSGCVRKWRRYSWFGSVAVGLGLVNVAGVCVAITLLYHVGRKRLIEPTSRRSADPSASNYI